jgi:hypothetical protein
VQVQTQGIDVGMRTDKFGFLFMNLEGYSRHMNNHLSSLHKLSMCSFQSQTMSMVGRLFLKKAFDLDEWLEIM